MKKLLLLLLFMPLVSFGQTYSAVKKEIKIKKENEYNSYGAWKNNIKYFNETYKQSSHNSRIVQYKIESRESSSFSSHPFEKKAITTQSVTNSTSWVIGMAIRKSILKAKLTIVQENC